MCRLFSSFQNSAFINLPTIAKHKTCFDILLVHSISHASSFYLRSHAFPLYRSESILRLEFNATPLSTYISCSLQSLRETRFPLFHLLLAWPIKLNPNAFLRGSFDVFNVFKILAFDVFLYERPSEILGRSQNSIQCNRAGKLNINMPKSLGRATLICIFPLI